MGNHFPVKMAKVLLFLVAATFFVITEAKKPISKPWKQPQNKQELDENASRFFTIWPGTKWCGPGNNAANFDDLADGAGRPADLCCREHDHCPDNIGAFQSKYGIWNWRPYTLSPCDCDNKFLTCMTNNKDLISTNIAELFFNTLKVPCFREDGSLERSTFTPLVKVLRSSDPSSLKHGTFSVLKKSSAILVDIRSLLL